MALFTGHTSVKIQSAPKKKSKNFHDPVQSLQQIHMQAWNKLGYQHNP